MTTKAGHDTHAKAHEDKKRHGADEYVNKKEETHFPHAHEEKKATPTALEKRVAKLERVLASVSPEAAEALKKED